MSANWGAWLRGSLKTEPLSSEMPWSCKHGTSVVRDALLLSKTRVNATVYTMLKVRAALGGRLKLIVSGAAPLPKEICMDSHNKLQPAAEPPMHLLLQLSCPCRQLEEFIRVTMCCNAGQGYGLTETCSATCLAPADRFDMLGTVGPVQTCAEFKVISVPELGYDASSDTPRGELLVSGPCLFSGYYRDHKSTEDVLKDDGDTKWFHTGRDADPGPQCEMRAASSRKKRKLKTLPTTVQRRGRLPGVPLGPKHL
eukprot:scaffold23393_cov18-Tisochrysis_lutea.AAC.1